jgi:hypothetical protein
MLGCEFVSHTEELTAINSLACLNLNLTEHSSPTVLEAGI